jgi:hypothetical protein
MDVVLTDLKEATDRGPKSANAEEVKALNDTRGKTNRSQQKEPQQLGSLAIHVPASQLRASGLVDIRLWFTAHQYESGNTPAVFVTGRCTPSFFFHARGGTAPGTRTVQLLVRSTNPYGSFFLPSIDPDD